MYSEYKNLCFFPEPLMQLKNKNNIQKLLVSDHKLFSSNNMLNWMKKKKILKIKT